MVPNSATHHISSRLSHGKAVTTKWYEKELKTASKNWNNFSKQNYSAAALQLINKEDF